MAIYCGIDFHPRQQSVSDCDADNGEIHYRERLCRRNCFCGYITATSKR